MRKPQCHKNPEVMTVFAMRHIPGPGRSLMQHFIDLRSGSRDQLCTTVGLRAK